MKEAGSELSERELEILRLLATGASNKEIAVQLFISANTVKVHLRNIFAKIGVSSRTEAAMYAVNLGLAPSGRVNQDFSTVSPEPSVSRSSQLILLRYWPVAALAAVLALVATIWVWQTGARNNPENSQLGTLPQSAWSVNAPLTEPRTRMAATAYAGQIYIIGGKNTAGITGMVEIYDPASDSWKPGAEKPTPVRNAAAVVIGGRILVPGGEVGSGETTEILEIYDPQTDHWGVGAPLPKPVSAYGLVAFDGAIYLFGGWDGKTYRSEAYRYDPETDVWIGLPAMPSGRAFMGAAVVGREIILAGGEDGTGELRINEIFSPDLKEANPWRHGAELPYGLAGIGMVSVADSIYVLGGESDTEIEFPILVYNYSMDEWRTLPTYEQVRLGAHFGAVTLGPFIYLLGGEQNDELMQKNIKYQVFHTISLPIISK